MGMGRLRKLLGLHQHRWELVGSYVYKRPNRAAIRSASPGQRMMMPSSEAFTEDVEARTFKCSTCGEERRKDQRLGG